jgi:hypothetical protein
VEKIAAKSSQTASVEDASDLKGRVWAWFSFVISVGSVEIRITAGVKGGGDCCSG